MDGDGRADFGFAMPKSAAAGGGVEQRRKKNPLLLTPISPFHLLFQHSTAPCPGLLPL